MLDQPNSAALTSLFFLNCKRAQGGTGFADASVCGPCFPETQPGKAQKGDTGGSPVLGSNEQIFGADEQVSGRGSERLIKELIPQMGGYVLT